MIVTHEERSALNRNNSRWIEALVKSGNDPAKIKDIPPIFMVLDLTWECNYDCRDCIDGGAAGRKPDMPKIPYNIIEDLIGYATKNDVRGLMIMGGEVELYNDNGKTIDDFFSLVADSSLPISMVSNGSLLGDHLESAKRIFSRQGSSLRVSINADRKHYHEQTRSIHTLDSVLRSMHELSKSDVKILVTTVVWGQGAYEQLGFENVSQLHNIVADVSATGVTNLLFIPSRDPKTHKNRYLSKQDEDRLNSLCGNYNGMDVRKAELFDEYKQVSIDSQDKSYSPCPSNLLRALVGSDCRLYACTDHRGEKDAVIGEIKEPGDFAKVWHSAERVLNQIAFAPTIKCSGIPCMRYALNRKLADAIVEYRTAPSQELIEKLLLPASSSFSF
jgi:sulfatase maturation enzyme AslB (radical SAM superfamily)